MKKIKIFKIGDEIPSDAVFIAMDKEIQTSDFNIPGTNQKMCKQFPVKIFYYEVKERSYSSPSKDNYNAEIEEIIDHLNFSTGKRFSKKTDQTKKLIMKWLKQGFRVDDFKLAIDNKCKDWLGNMDMEQYLRPVTLFGSKFESYLNAVMMDESDVFKGLDSYMQLDETKN